MPPFFNSMMFMPQFKDHSWISDTTTFCPDSKLLWENAALSMQLSGMYNIYYSANPYPNMDAGSLLNMFWSTAYQAANASLATSLGSLPMMQNQFTPFNPLQQMQQAQQAQDPKPKTDLTEAQKEEFASKQEEYNEVIKKYEKIDKSVAEKLGLDTVIESAKKAFAKADTPEKVEKCLDDINAKITSILEEASVEDLKLILPKQNDTKDLKGLDTKIEELYIESTDFDTIHNLICGADPVITAENVIEEMNLRQGETCLIDELTQKGDGDKLKQVVRTLVNAIRTRSSKDAIKDMTRDARIVLLEASNLYSKYPNEGNRENLVKAYINLYNAVRTAEASLYDTENERFAKTLPAILKEAYLKDGNLKPEFKMPVLNDGFTFKSSLIGKVEGDAARAEADATPEEVDEEVDEEDGAPRNTAAANLGATQKGYSNTVVQEQDDTEESRKEPSTFQKALEIANSGIKLR